MSRSEPVPHPPPGSRAVTSATARHGRVTSAAVTAAMLLSVFGAVPATGSGDTPTESAHASSEAESRIDFTSWANGADWRLGAADGVTVLPGQRTGIIMTSAVDTVTVRDTSGAAQEWEYSTWTSPLVELEFDATELVASWNAGTPAGTWISVEVQGTYTDGDTTPWYEMGRWTASDTAVPRASVDNQSDDHSAVFTDTLVVGPAVDHDDVVEPIDDTGRPGESSPLDNDATGAETDTSPLLSAYQTRVTMYRPPGSTRMPRVWMLGAMASNIPPRTSVPPSAGGEAWGEELAVPRRSKYTHLDNYPEYGGGEGWSSPTATTMVMEYFGVMPPRSHMAWIEAGYKDPQVAHAARMTWDHAFEGAGNWPFNTAYAASFRQLDAFITRLRSLDDIERFIAAGIPVITSQSFSIDELDGAGYSTSGTLMVVVGFTDGGDVIVNDPAAESTAGVRRIYDREQFEQVWLRTRRVLPGDDVGTGSGGIVYVIKPYQHELPAPTGQDHAW
ncbi:C39 family peptidase [Phytoactinopolyspora limicola]|uniref:C39 family peptidase n=1 Tax=Phytoactinopolyspora limicola TaxID=2715536 RepID=UPI001A9C62BF|nr:C39 family peptidase [Phytoactinopolyspora limicola]